MITLLTDFGLRDHYVAAMKGVILSIHPDVQLVDISHDVAPYQILEGAYVLSQVWRYFPPGTIHVSVVDPGVGSSRGIILVEANGHYFLAPDNGLLTLVVNSVSAYWAWQVTASQYFAKSVSRTFHGRDILAPVAAHLASGVPAGNFGPELSEIMRLPLAVPEETSSDQWTGAILQIDRFGNIITSFPLADFEWVTHQSFELKVGSFSVTRYYPNYSAAETGEPFVLVGSGGYLEVSLNQGSAGNRLGAASGDALTLVRL